MCEGGRLIHCYLCYTWKEENMDEMIHIESKSGWIEKQN